MGKTIFLVHGTFAQPREGAPQWYQRATGDPDGFAGRIETDLRSRGYQGSIAWRVFTWSGANTHAARVNGAVSLHAELADVLDAAPDEDVFVIAHSHGGNVAARALALLHRRNREARRAFTRLVYALSIERLKARAAAERVIAELPLSTVLASLVVRAAKTVGWAVPKPRASRRAPEWGHQYVERLLKKAPLINWLQEPFCLEWSTERPPRVTLVTLGTPFLDKQWQRPGRGAILWRATIHCTLAAVLVAVLLVAGGTVRSPIVLPAPEGSPAMFWTILLAWIAAAIYLYWRLTHLYEVWDDTNIYFDLPRQYATAGGAARRRCRLLAIHATFLDEALLALSTEPLLYGELKPRLGRPFSPALSWRPRTLAAGVRPIAQPLMPTVAMLIRLGLELAFRWAANVLWTVPLKLLAWFFSPLTRRLILSAVRRAMLGSSLGLPDNEIRNATIDVAVAPAPSAFLDIQAWDATQYLIEQPRALAVLATTRPEWGFLWDEQLLTKEVQLSRLWARFRPALRGRREESDPNAVRRMQRLCIALERRVREAAGLVPLNHSAYYENTQVIERIGVALSSASGGTTGPPRDMSA
jgi:hypothetical protein